MSLLVGPRRALLSRAAGDTFAASLLVDLVDFWRLEEASGARLGILGTSLADVNTVTGGTGKIGQAALYTSTASESLSNALAAASFTGDFTISAWANPSSLASAVATYGRGIACYLNNDAVGGWQLSVTIAGAVRFVHWRSTPSDATGAHVTADSLIAESVWTHILIRRLAGVYTIWINGVSVGFSDGDSASGWGAPGFRIGTQYLIGAGYHWHSLLDAVGLWSRAISDAEIAYLYNAGAGRELAA